MKKKIKGLFKNWIYCLFLITVIAIIIRSIPAWTNSAWGCDFGIYYGLAKSFVESGGEWFNPYAGWGNSYNYFPVLYAIVGFAHWITGIDVLIIMTRLIPIFGGLTVLIFYFVVHELTKDKKVALLSSLFLAVLPFHVYQTSHASPLTLGHFFMMLCIFFFLKYRQKIWYFFPLIISTVLLIMSHHLTTYFYLICLIFIILVENASSNEWTNWVKKDVLYTLFTSGLIFSYWAFVATPVFETFIIEGISIGSFTINSTIIVILFYIFFICLFGFILIIRRINAFLKDLGKKNKTVFWKFIWHFIGLNIFYKKKQHSIRKSILIFLTTLIVIYSIMIIFSFFKLPWTNFTFTPTSIAYSAPLLFVFAFWISGFRETWNIKNGLFIRGWTLALIASLLFTSLTDNQTIFPHRHFEYLMAPVAIVAVLGINRIFLNLDYKKLSKKFRKRLHIVKSKIKDKDKKRISQKKSLLHAFVIVILVTTNALSVYPSHESLGQSYEKITTEDISAIEWISENLNKNTSRISSDHRLERMIEAEGLNTTQDEMLSLWAEPVENKAEYISELYRIGENYTFNHVTHVLIDDIMKNIVVHVVFRTEGINMTHESYEKFSPPIFEMVHESKSVEINPENGEPLHWARVFKINWSYLWKSSSLKDIT